jgi:hypothetical protein
MVLPAAQRRDCIAHVASTYAPDLLLCAGWSLDNDADLNKLANDVRVSKGKTTLIVEVRYSSGERDPKTETQRVHLVGPINFVQPLGRQTIVTSKQLKGRDGQSRIMLFQKYINEKSATFQGKKLFALCCGEIYVLEGGWKRPVTARFPAAYDALRNADIIVNPTHDRMGMAGTLASKRKWLSDPIGPRSRVYVSSSNWNSQKQIGIAEKNGQKYQKQKPATETLHTVYFCGEWQDMISLPGGPEDAPCYMYRQCEVPL